jgi:hypothetical protein
MWWIASQRRGDLRAARRVHARRAGSGEIAGPLERRLCPIVAFSDQPSASKARSAEPSDFSG